MSLLDKNKIFFGLLHYIFSEQKNVDWALKTSLVNYTGINSTVNNKKYQQDSVIQDVIDYIYQIKPYHVEFEQFIEKYSSQRDEVNVSGADGQEKNNITFYIRFDAVTSTVDPQGDMNDIEYMDTHAANRLYAYKTKNLEDIKDYLNCHFKGITINGSTFNVDNSGYDAFLYDSTLYDAPTVTNDWCVVDYTENLDHEYVKKFVNVGIQTFVIDNEDLLQHQFVTVTSEFLGKTTEIADFSLENNMLTLFDTIRNTEKITVTEDKEGVKKSWIYVGHSFCEKTSDSEVDQFISWGTEYFTIPEGGFNSNKVTVHIESPNGTRDLSENTVVTNWQLVGNQVYIPFDKENDCYFDKRLVRNGHVVITTIDYYYIYDKIYTWEDRYGQSNNTITLSGNKFLRPYYEVERPSELCVSAPLPYLMIYNVDDNGMPTNLYGVDYKHYQYKSAFPKVHITTLRQDLNIGDSEIHVASVSKLKAPVIEDDLAITPGKIIINSEIIEFYEVDKENKTLKRLRRGAEGSYLAEHHASGSYVIDFRDSIRNDYSSKSTSIMTYVTKDMENKFVIPGVLTDIDKVNVMVKPMIRLLTPITFTSTYFDISSNNISLPGNILLNIPKRDNFVVHSNQTLNITIGGKQYNFQIGYQINSVDDFVTFIKNSASNIDGFSATTDENNIILISQKGKAIVMSNGSGTPLQEIVGNYAQGVNAFTDSDTPIMKDGSNGLRINRANVVWGADKSSPGWMKDNPTRGTLQDAADSINNLSATRGMVRAEIYDGKLVIIPLTNEEITIANLTSPDRYEDNVNILGLPTYTPASSLYTENMTIEANIPSIKGYIFINDEKVYFENIQQMATNHYRITNFYINEEYNTDSIIYSEKPELLSRDDFVITTEEVAYSNDESTINNAEKIEVNYVILRETPQEGHIVIVSNDE